MTNSPRYALARGLSTVLNPLTVMAAVMGWVFFVRVDSRVLALGFWGAWAFFGFVLPLSYVMWLRRRGQIADIFIADRAQRRLPLAWTAFCYGCGACALWFLGAPREALALMFCCACLAALMFGLAPFAKISLHAVGIWSGFVAVVFWGAPVSWVLLPIAVSWARVADGAHTRIQVIVGGLLGGSVTYLILCGLADPAG